jgi:cysteine desulfurase
MKKIYLDNAATTPVDREVLKAMMPYFSDKFGNPMSLHSFGGVASEAIEKSRNAVANFLGCAENEIIFTSGATESNNLAIKGLLSAYYNNIRVNSLNISSHSQVIKPHIITTQFEHHCVLHACQSLEKDNLAEVTYLPVYKNGIVKIADIKKTISKNTILISVMYVNNEIGTVQPISRIGKMIKNYKLKTKNHKLIFHTDATQAANYFDCDVEKLGVDLLSLSGHKIYGPKGIGALYIKKGTPIAPIIDGGGQEFDKRSGTHNVPGIVGLAEAIKQVIGHRSSNKNILSLRDYFIKKVLKEIPGSYLNGSKIKRSPNNINLRFDNVEGESLILMLDQEGIAASTGSACSTGSLQPSHVLLALGLKPEQAHGSLRITLGKYNTKKEIDVAIDALKKVINKLSSISGNLLKDFYNHKT